VLYTLTELSECYVNNKNLLSIAKNGILGMFYQTCERKLNSTFFVVVFSNYSSKYESKTCLMYAHWRYMPQGTMFSVSDTIRPWYFPKTVRISTWWSTLPDETNIKLLVPHLIQNYSI